jgi:hypothetical protein
VASEPNSEPSHRREQAGLDDLSLDVAHHVADADRSEPDAAHRCDRWWWPDDHRGAARLDGLARHGSAQEPDRVAAEPQPAQGPEQQRLRAQEPGPELQP